MAFWKKLNQTNDIRVLKDELVFDVTPTVNSTNPVTSDGIARAIAGASGEVPVVTENDNGKILTAIYDEGGPAVEWGAAAPGTEYTAGAGIAISAQNAVSVKTGSGLAINSGSSSGSITLQTLDTTGGAWGLNSLGVLTADAVAALRAGAVTVTPVGTFTAAASEGLTPYIAVLAINNYGYPNKNAGFIVPVNQPSMPLVDTSFTLASTPFSIDFSQLDADKTTLSFDTVAANPSSYCIAMIAVNSSFSSINPGSTTGSSYGTYQDCSTLSYTVVGDDSVYVTNPVPTPGNSDTNKVLTVTNSSGAFGWAAAPTELPSVTGNAGKVLTVNSGATGVEWASAGGGGGGLPSTPTDSDHKKVLGYVYDIDTQANKPAWVYPCAPGGWSYSQTSPTQSGNTFTLTYDSYHTIPSDHVGYIVIGRINSSDASTTQGYWAVSVYDNNYDHELADGYVFYLGQWGAKGIVVPYYYYDGSNTAFTNKDLYVKFTPLDSQTGTLTTNIWKVY